VRLGAPRLPAPAVHARRLHGTLRAGHGAGLRGRGDRLRPTPDRPAAGERRPHLRARVQFRHARIVLGAGARQGEPHLRARRRHPRLALRPRLARPPRPPRGGPPTGADRPRLPPHPHASEPLPAGPRAAAHGGLHGHRGLPERGRLRDGDDGPPLRSLARASGRERQSGDRHAPLPDPPGAGVPGRRGAAPRPDRPGPGRHGPRRYARRANPRWHVLARALPAPHARGAARPGAPRGCAWRAGGARSRRTRADAQGGAPCGTRRRAG